MIDRPIRPLFPDYFFDEVQISSVLLSADGVNEPDVLAMVGASASLMLSDLPFQGPIGAVRVGLIDGKYVINPTRAQMEESKLELIYAGRPGQVIMIEGEAEFVSEQQMKEAMYAADEAIRKQCDAQIELAKKAGRPKKEYKLYPVPEALKKALETFCADRIEGVCTIPGKEDRMNAMDALRDDARKALRADFPDLDDNQFTLETAKGFDDLVRTVTRNVILTKQFRPDGRSITEIRPLSAEVGVLPVVHGSALFSRGETQALVLATLGNEKDAQEYDDLTSETGISKKRFYLHYNFPNFSVGEVGRITGPGRREIGHGNLAERSVSKVVPKDFPYVVRCVSEIMSSNGSTSMASVCGATLALMDAGVPITAPVAGISCGLVTGENGERLLLTDIIGAEDHFGDMDFKVCGTRDGITGFQLDLKLPGIPIDLLCEGMERNRIARLKILDVIEACIPAPRPEISSRAPRLEVIQINPEKIGALIGPGGKNIRAITEETGQGAPRSGQGAGPRQHRRGGDRQDLSRQGGDHPRLRRLRRDPARRGRPPPHLGDGRLPGQQGDRHLRRGAVCHGQGDRHRSGRQDPAEPEGGAQGARRVRSSDGVFFTGAVFPRPFCNGRMVVWQCAGCWIRYSGSSPGSPGRICSPLRRNVRSTGRRLRRR